ncbi:MAG: glycosyltransferase family 4 protein [Planctomycetes bacterium]|nr:glycosyltransferase family 4 protein [Planctomycetota bacterium]
MKILIPTHFPLEGSGSGVYVANLAEELLGAGHFPHVIAPDYATIRGQGFPCTTILCAGGDAPRPDLPFSFPCFTTHPRSANTFYELTDPQVETYVQAHRNAINRAVRESQPDLIHAQHLWVAAACAAETGLPFVITSHGTDLIGLRKDPRFRPMVQKAVGQAARIIAVSSQVARDIKTMLPIPDRKIVVIGNGFDPSLFHPGAPDRETVLRRMGIAEPCRYVVTFVGKLTHFKGADVLIHAAEEYENRADSVLTLIIGDGELRGELENMVHRHTAQGIRFLGHRPQADVAELMRIADVHAVPSRGEPFGIAALEALACGTPVVGTQAGGLPDFITPEVGSLAAVDNPIALGNLIVRDLKSGSKRTKGPVAARYALDGFTWEKQVAKIVAVYREIT